MWLAKQETDVEKKGQSCGGEVWHLKYLMQRYGILVRNSTWVKGLYELCEGPLNVSSLLFCYPVCYHWHQALSVTTHTEYVMLFSTLDVMLLSVLYIAKFVFFWSLINWILHMAPLKKHRFAWMQTKLPTTLSVLSREVPCSWNLQNLLSQVF